MVQQQAKEGGGAPSRQAAQGGSGAWASTEDAAVILPQPATAILPQPATATKLQFAIATQPQPAGDKLHASGRCRSVRYCSPGFQATHWSNALEGGRATRRRARSCRRNGS